MNDWLGCYGTHPNASTPSIDAFAKTALRFDRAITPIPLCNPSRTAILTGINPWRSGIYGNRAQFRNDGDFTNIKTLPESFKENGYTTIAAGKLFHNSSGPRSDPQSWTISKGGVGTPGSDKTKKHLYDQYLKGYFQESFKFGSIAERKVETSDFKNADWIVRKIDELPKDQPFFAAYGCFRPHLPWLAPQVHFDRHPINEIAMPQVLTNDLDDVPSIGAGLARGTNIDFALKESGLTLEAIQGYLACCSFADSCVGRLLRHISNHKHLRDSTIVVVTSDHGWMLGEKEAWSKFKPWHRSVKVPLLIRVPGVTAAGSTTDVPVTLMDLFPTLISLCEIEVGHKIDGMDITPILTNQDPPEDRHVISSFNRQSNFTIENKNYRLIRYWNGQKELYNIKKDPNEWHNLANDENYEEIIEDLENRLPKNPKEAI